MIAFSNGFEYWSKCLSQEATGKRIYVELFYENKYINDRIKRLEKYGIRIAKQLNRNSFLGKGLERKIFRLL